jgi:hypothetical protein
MTLPAPTAFWVLVATVGCGSGEPTVSGSGDPPDQTPPAWSESPTLDVTRIEQRSAIASWSEAFDDSGEVLYLVHIDGVESGTSHTPYRRLSGLIPGHLHHISIVAVDPSGNASAEALQTAFRTPYGCEARGVALPRRIH